MSGIPFAPLVPASFIFASAYVMIISAEFLANGFWNEKSAAEIISFNDYLNKITYSVGFISVCLMIYGVSLLKYLWHLGMRKITDRTRRDGRISGPAPLQFFIFHTSGVASWLGVIMLAFAITIKLFPRRPFTTIDEFFRENLSWKLAAGALLILFLVKYFESNTRIFIEIYKNENLVGKVRRASLIIPVGLFFFVTIGGMFSALWLLNKASMLQGSLALAH
jgi:hypothetical protein